MRKQQHSQTDGAEALAAERRDKVLDLIKKDGRVIVTRDSERLGISRSTLHRDLGELARLGLITRVRGGAVAHGARRIERRFDVRLGVRQDEKRQIAQTCVADIRDDMSIFLDHSSSCFYVAEALSQKKFRSLVVVSNSLAIAELLGGIRGIEMLMTGGRVEPEFRALSGRHVVDFISRMNLNRIFVSCAAISAAEGLMTQVPFIRDLVQDILDLRRPVSLLVDNSKFDVTATFVIAPISPLIRIVTDRSTPSAARAPIAAKGVEIVG